MSDFVERLLDEVIDATFMSRAIQPPGPPLTTLHMRGVPHGYTQPIDT